MGYGSNLWTDDRNLKILFLYHCCRFFSPLGMVPVVALVGIGLFERGFPVVKALSSAYSLLGHHVVNTDNLLLSFLIIYLMFSDCKLCGNRSSDARPVCCTFSIFEACTNVQFPNIREVLSADLRCTCVVICPNPHCEWSIQT